MGFRRLSVCFVLTALLLCAGRGRAEDGSEPVPRLVSQSASVIESNSEGRSTSALPTLASIPETLSSTPQTLASPQNIGGSLQTVLLLSVVSLAPAILLMTTCYVRIIIVLSLLRQAIGLQSLPPTQVLTSISLFMTLLVMTPTWTRVYEDAIQPYSDPEIEMTLGEAYQAASTPVRLFMSRQIDAAKNHADVMLFYRHAFPEGPAPSSFSDVPMRVLLPAYVISELKVAFLMGFSIYLPFLVVDLVVASVTMSMGMFMLPPAMVSLPLKLLLFVLVDGWHLIVGMLLTSFGTH